MTTAGSRTPSLRIERTLPAPPDVIWKLWTEPEHFAAWYGPDGSPIPEATMDLRVGGTRLLRMEVTTPEGSMAMWFTGVFLEIVENQRLVYTDSMSDELGTVLSAQELGMPADHPTTTRVEVVLEPVADGTRMVLTHHGIPAESPGAVGWTKALDKLAAHLQLDANH